MRFPNEAKLETVSILVAPDGMTPRELRQKFLWLPTIEQLISQLEARQAILFHTGLELSTGACVYKTVLRANTGNIECVGNSMRSAIGLALKDLIVRQSGCTGMH
jgi:hypothetical protein